MCFKNVLAEVLCFMVIVLIPANNVCCYSPDHAIEQGYYLDNVDTKPPKPGWIDPYDMLGETLQTSDTSLITQNDVENHILKTRVNSCNTHLRKFVNLFLKAVDLKDSDTSFNSVNFVKMEFLIKGEDLNELKHFGQHGNTGEEVEKMSLIFSKIFTQNQNRHEFKFQAGYILDVLKSALITVLRSPEWVVVSSVSFMLLLTLWIIFVTRAYRLALFTVFLTIFFAGFGFNWMRMYEEKEAETFSTLIMYRGEVPYHCSGNPMVWYENIYYKLFGIDCYDYFKARDVRPLVKISPTDVLAETLSSMIINPAAKIGSVYGNFVKNMIDAVPWWLMPIAVVFSFIIPPVFTIIFLVFLFNYQINLSPFGFSLKPHFFISENKESNKYIEEISLTKSKLQEVNVVQKLSSNTETPLFFVCNWLGLKKLCSDTEISEKEIKDSENIPSKISNCEDSDEKNIESLTENKGVEENTVLKDCKLRTKSVDSVPSESSHSNSSKDKCEHLYPNLTLCDQNQPPIINKEKNL